MNADTAIIDMQAEQRLFNANKFAAALEQAWEHRPDGYAAGKSHQLFALLHHARSHQKACSQELFS